MNGNPKFPYLMKLIDEWKNSKVICNIFLGHQTNWQSNIILIFALSFNCTFILLINVICLPYLVWFVGAIKFSSLEEVSNHRPSSSPTIYRTLLLAENCSLVQLVVNHFVCFTICYILYCCKISTFHFWRVKYWITHKNMV